MGGWAAGLRVGAVSAGEWEAAAQPCRREKERLLLHEEGRLERGAQTRAAAADGAGLPGTGRRPLSTLLSLQDWYREHRRTEPGEQGACETRPVFLACTWLPVAGV